MSAYLVFTREKTINAEELATYMKMAPGTRAGHDSKVLARYGPHEDLEGSPTEGTVILEFPDAAAAKAWYESPSYREAREHRLAGSIYRVILVEGV